jgi:hypothetical protein
MKIGVSAHQLAARRVITDLLEGATSRSHGRLILLCYLLQTADGVEAAAQVPQVLRLCWASTAYHIMLDGLRMARSFASAVEGQPLHGEIAEAGTGACRAAGVCAHASSCLGQFEVGLREIVTDE